METKWIVGTGFSRGIGTQVARLIQERDFKIFHIGRNKCGFEEDFLNCNLAESISEHTTNELRNKLSTKKIHGFLYGAGIFPRLNYNYKSITQTFEFWESQQKSIRVNYLSCAELTEEIIPYLIDSSAQSDSEQSHSQATPFVAHISSLAAVDPLPGFEFYGITKLATLEYFKNLSQKFDAKLLNCLAMHPGTVKTDMLDNLMNSTEYIKLPVIDILNHEIKENRVISSVQSAEYITNFLFNKDADTKRVQAHGKLYLVQNECNWEVKN